jgi:hypothetical protein
MLIFILSLGEFFCIDFPIFEAIASIDWKSLRKKISLALSGTFFQGWLEKTLLFAH